MLRHSISRTPVMGGLRYLATAKGGAKGKAASADPWSNVTQDQDKLKEQITSHMVRAAHRRLRRA